MHMHMLVKYLLSISLYFTENFSCWMEKENLFLDHAVALWWIYWPGLTELTAGAMPGAASGVAY